MEKYENDKNDFLQTQRIKQLDKYSIRIKYSYLHSSTNRKLFHAFVIKTEPVYTCKKRLLQVSSLWYHLKTYTNFYFKKLVCFVLKLIKFASKHDSYSNRTVGFRILISIYIFASEWFRFKRQTSCCKT